MSRLYLPVVLAGALLLDRILFDGLEARLGLPKLHATMPGYRDTLFPRLLVSAVGSTAMFLGLPENGSSPLAVIAGGFAFLASTGYGVWKTLSGR